MLVTNTLRSAAETSALTYATPQSSTKPAATASTALYPGAAPPSAGISGGSGGGTTTAADVSINDIANGLAAVIGILFPANCAMGVCQPADCSELTGVCRA